jgi:hypothetical protein
VKESEVEVLKLEERAILLPVIALALALASATAYPDPALVMVSVRAEIFPATTVLVSVTCFR